MRCRPKACDEEVKREQAVFVCSHVFGGAQPILLVVHEGGDWQCLCGGTHRADEKPRVVGLDHLVEWGGRVKDVLDLPEGWEAERTSMQGAWSRRPIGS